MRSMIDKLHFYVSHAPDLTEVSKRIPVAAARNLCLEVSGTSVVLGRCNGSAAQKWVYDRTNGTMYNPQLNKCLEMQRYDLGHTVSSYKEVEPTPGTPVVSAECAWTITIDQTTVGTGPCAGQQGDDLKHCVRYQRWTYDPVTQMLSNAFGTVLDVQGGKLSDGTKVWIWERNDAQAERWFADPGNLWDSNYTFFQDDSGI